MHLILNLRVLYTFCIDKCFAKVCPVSDYLDTEEFLASIKVKGSSLYIPIFSLTRAICNVCHFQLVAIHFGLSKAHSFHQKCWLLSWSYFRLRLVLAPAQSSVKVQYLQFMTL